MGQKRHKPEEIVAKLRQVEVLTGQGRSIAEAARSIGVSEQTYFRSRRSRRGWPISNAHRPKAADEDVAVDGVAVTDDVSRRYFPTIGLGELVRNPFSRWVRSRSQPQDLAAIVLQNQQPLEQSE